ncbi:12857_t:CDS:2 [Ambispora gerdemannii]|uniref:12857_t:CDS:1 n=1 Tax=Ambispora gerdemannii TaxID=144530 RepID=A0A9N9C3M3_9GLOM|nr:12857_t:CDS:2 [Ambispora gerdemannii]
MSKVKTERQQATATLRKKQKKWEKTWQQCTARRIESEIIRKGIQVPSLFLSLEELLAPCKKTRTKSTTQRPQNDYVIYRKEVQAETLHFFPETKFTDISKIASEKWEAETQERRNFFTFLAAIGNLIHSDVFPDYQFKPNLKKKTLKSDTKFDRELQPWEQAASMPQPLSNPCMPTYSSIIPSPRTAFRRVEPKQRSSSSDCLSTILPRSRSRRVSIEIVWPRIEKPLVYNPPHVQLSLPDDPLKAFAEIAIAEAIMFNPSTTNHFQNNVSSSNHIFNNKM